MASHADKSSPTTASAETAAQQQHTTATFAFAENHPAAFQLKSLQSSIGSSPRMQETAQLHAVTQRKENKTGLPDNLKSGVENLSGHSLDDVKVHYNSSQPSQLNAHAYAQGTDIHVAPGQEKHLPHEAWHVVQQKQGRVKPTMQLKKSVAVNDDAGLENEADVMGAKAVQMKTIATDSLLTNTITEPVAQRALSPDQILEIKAEIAGCQAIVEMHRATITAGSRWNPRQRRLELRPNLRRNRLNALITSLEASVPARQSIVNLHAQLNEPDPGDHYGRAGNEFDLLDDAIADRDSIQQIDATDWVVDPDDETTETRTAARWQRDPVVNERRGVDDDGRGAYHPASGRRRRR